MDHDIIPQATDEELRQLAAGGHPLAADARAALSGDIDALDRCSAHLAGADL